MTVMATPDPQNLNPRTSGLWMLSAAPQSATAAFDLALNSFAAIVFQSWLARFSANKNNRDEY